jgi:hypothetical protein
MSFKKLTLLKYTVLYCLKLNKWIIMGIAIVKSANKNAGNKNFISDYQDYFFATISQISEILKSKNL